MEFELRNGHFSLKKFAKGNVVITTIWVILPPQQSPEVGWWAAKLQMKKKQMKTIFFECGCKSFSGYQNFDTQQSW